MAKDIFENLGDVMDFAPHVLIASCIVSIITLVTVAAFYRALILPLEPGTKLKLDDPEKGVYKGDKKDAMYGGSEVKAMNDGDLTGRDDPSACPECLHEGPNLDAYKRFASGGGCQPSTLKPYEKADFKLMTCEVQTSDGPKIYRACYRKSHRIAMTIADVDAADLPSDLQCVIEKDDVLGENLYAEHSDLKRAIANYAIDIKEMNTETAKLRAAKYGNRR